MPKQESMRFYRPGADDFLRPDAERGDANAQVALGRLYFEGRPQRATVNDTGKGVVVTSFTPAIEPNPIQAVKWVLRAANQGHAEARRLLGTVLVMIRGVH